MAVTIEESPLTFPKQEDKLRLQNYKYFDDLYNSRHFEAFSIKADKDMTRDYARLRYVVANFCSLTSRVIADMLFGEAVSVDLKDKTAQTWVSSFISNNSFMTQLYESALINSRRGDSVFKLRIGQLNPGNVADKETVIVEEIPASLYFPVFDNNSSRYRPIEDIIAWTFKQNSKVYLHREIHRAGYIFHEIYEYDPDSGKIIAQANPTEFGFTEEETTGLERSLVFHIPNYRDSGFFGPSDYREIDKLQFALNNRLTKIDNILDKHSDPILAVPPGVLDEEGKVKKEALGMFEVDNDTGNKPEYIVWNANLESAFTEVEKLVEMLFLMGEVSPASFGMDKNGVAESGRALKFRLLATIRKRNRKKIYYDQAIKDIIETAQMLGAANGIQIDGVSATNIERPNVIWPDGVINDEVEESEIVTQRLDNGTMSKADAIARLDGTSPDEAKEKAKEIEEENAIDLPLTTNLPNNQTNQNQEA